MLCGEEYFEAAGHTINVADPVGAGDAFAAAFLRGLTSDWPVAKIAVFANRFRSAGGQSARRYPGSGLWRRPLSRENEHHCGRKDDYSVSQWILAARFSGCGVRRTALRIDTAVISGATKALGGTFALSPLTLGITVSSALWGTVLGSLGAAAPSDRYGRRRCLRVLGCLYLVSSVGCAFAWSWAALIIFRAIGGLAIGASSVIGPMYIAEISPAAKRDVWSGSFR